MTINVSSAIVAIAAGSAAAPVSGQFAADGSASRTVVITVAQSLPRGYYPLVLSTTVGGSVRTFMLVVAVGEAGASSAAPATAGLVVGFLPASERQRVGVAPACDVHAVVE